MSDFEKAAQLIERAAETQRQLGEIVTLTGWMNALPGSIRRRYPALCLAYARALVDTSQNLTIESLIEDAEAGLEKDRTLDHRTSTVLRGQIAALRAYLAMIRHQYGETIERSHQAQECFGEDETRWRSFVGLTLANAYRFTNDWAAADQTYRAASDLSLAAGDRVNALLALSLRAEVLQAEGKLHQAAEQYEQILQLALDLGIPNAPVTGYALIGLGRVWCEWNDVEAADRNVRNGIEYGKKANIQDIVLRGYLVQARIYQAWGNIESALISLENAEPAARQMGMVEINDWIQALRVQLWMARGKTEEAIHWASSYSGELNDTIYPSIAIALAKAWLHQGQPEKALKLLDHALHSAQAVGRLGNATQILAVKACMQKKQGDLKNAIATLSAALSFAATEGYTRIFLDEGETMRLLTADVKTSLEHQPPGTIPDPQKQIFNYAHRLLIAFSSSSISRSRDTIGRSFQASIPEPLSERELVVLRLMAAGLSNRDIADRDVVSINTVKTQVKSIYGKLGAHNRADAIAAAQNLGLI
jgi:LuxR family maltose regulon positive regulatory protein